LQYPISLLEIMAVVVQERNSSVFQEKSISDCDDLSTDAASSCGLNDRSASSGSDSDDVSPKRPTALRLSARCYQPREAEVSCVLGILMNYLRSIPTVRNVAQEWSGGGKTMRCLVTVPAESIGHADEVLMGAQQTLLSAAYNSQNTYVMGHARNPFTSLGVRWGFQGQLCTVDEKLCMDKVDFGRCNRWCPHTVCHRKHPQASQLTEVIVEIQVSCGLPPGLTEAGPPQLQVNIDCQFIVDAQLSMKHRFAHCQSL